MSRITNIASMIARRVYATQEKNLNRVLERLSTGMRINRGADDPAGLIASERLRSEKVGLRSAIANAQRASNVVATAEGGLNEVSSLLLELDGLVTTAANESGLSEGEMESKQLEIDSILGAIDRIANTTVFADKKLLNGSMDFDLSGVPASAIRDVSIRSSRLYDSSKKNVVVEVYQSALFGQLKFSGSRIGSENLTVQVMGNNGVQVFSFVASTTIAEVATAINQTRDLTGVSATLSGTGALYLNSVGLGTDSFVSVKAIDGIFNVTGGEGGMAKGRDAGVRINGAQAYTRGVDVSFNTGSLSMELTLDRDFSRQLSTRDFQITGGGTVFAISPHVTDGRDVLGIPSVASGSLGRSSEGLLSSLGSGGDNDLSSGNFRTSQQIVRSAIKQVASQRARLGAYQRFTLETSINSMQVALENVTAAESSIRDADYAMETSNMVKAQIMMQSSSAILRQANQMPNIILALLS